MTEAPRLRLQEPAARPKRSSKSFAILAACVISLSGGGAGGFWLARNIEARADYKSHAALLTPLLRYEERVRLGRKRGSNETMRIVSYHVFLARDEGLDLNRFLDLAQPPEVIPPNLAALNKERFLSNLRLGDEYGLFTPANLARLAKGEAPYVTRGEYQGQQAQVEHIVPVAIAPQMDNLLCNLEWLPGKLNASKGDTVDERTLKIAEKFRERGVMSDFEFEKVSQVFSTANGDN